MTPRETIRANWLFICEHCNHTVRDGLPHAGDLVHRHDDGSEHIMRRTQDDDRELSVEQDFTHPDNLGIWMA